MPVRDLTKPWNRGVISIFVFDEISLEEVIEALVCDSAPTIT